MFFFRWLSFSTCQRKQTRHETLQEKWAWHFSDRSCSLVTVHSIQHTVMWKCHCQGHQLISVRFFIFSSHIFILAWCILPLSNIIFLTFFFLDMTIEFDWCDSRPLERRVLGYIPEACLLLVPGSIHLSGIICTSHSFKNKFN